MDRIVTLPTSTKLALLLDTAMRRAAPERIAFLQRLSRSLAEYGSLTSVRYLDHRDDLAHHDAEIHDRIGRAFQGEGYTHGERKR
jgi:hypothetical protein